MQNIGELMHDYKVDKASRADVTLVERIIEVAGEHPKYNFKYWLAKIHRSKLSPNQILDICDEADKLDTKYCKGGYIVKRL